MTGKTPPRGVRFFATHCPMICMGFLRTEHFQNLLTTSYQRLMNIRVQKYPKYSNLILTRAPSKTRFLPTEPGKQRQKGGLLPPTVLPAQWQGIWCLSRLAKPLPPMETDTDEYPKQRSHAFPSAEELRAVFQYDPITGVITKNGKKATSARKKDFKRIVRYGDRTLMAARVAFCLHTGEDIGHRYVVLIDGQEGNLCWDNLVDIDPYDQQKAKARRNNIPDQERTSSYRPDAKTAPNPLPDVETLRSMFSYNPETGELRWKVGKINRHGPQREVGSLVVPNNKSSHPRVRVGKATYLVHRIIWKMHTGEDPGRMQLDHKNGDPRDNRIKNLRLATPRDNQRNKGPGSLNKSGFKGVSWNKATGRWTTRLSYDKVAMSYGEYDTAEEANDVLVAAREMLHGEFARHQ